MSWRFWRRIKIFPGVRLNLSKKGASVSVGPRGAKITVGTKGARTTVGLPGTGLFASESRKWGNPAPPKQQPSPFPGPLYTINTDRLYLLQQLLNERIAKWEHAWSEATVGDMDVLAFSRWAIDHMAKLKAIEERLRHVLQVELTDAMAAPGDSANISTALDKTAEVVNWLGQWEQEIRIYAEHPVFAPIATQMVGMSWPYLQTLKNFKSELDDQLVTLAQTKKILIHTKVEEIPHVAALEAAVNDLNERAFSGKAAGDLFQMRFRVNRAETPVGEFSRQSLIENCKAGLVKPSDMYLSKNQGDWKRLDELETNEPLEFGTSATSS